MGTRERESSGFEWGRERGTVGRERKIQKKAAHMFSEILYNLRERDGLSQSRFACEIGFSQAAISAWENDTREPGIEALKRIAQYFNVSVDYLVGGTKEKNTKKSTANKLTTKAEELLDIFNGLDPMYQAQILEYARYIATRVNNTKKYKGDSL